MVLIHATHGVIPGTATPTIYKTYFSQHEEEKDLRKEGEAGAGCFDLTAWWCMLLSWIMDDLSVFLIHLL